MAKRITNELRHDWLERIFHVVVFMAAFILIGWLVPSIYYQYFDNTKYYEIALPIKVEQKNYSQCDIVNVYISRRSLIDGTGKAIIQLNLLREDDGSVERIDSITREIAFIKTDGFQTVVAHWKIPCGIQSGKYYFDGSLRYSVKGIEKTQAIETEPFVVINE